MLLNITACAVNTNEPLDYSIDDSNLDKTDLDIETESFNESSVESEEYEQPPVTSNEDDESDDENSSFPKIEYEDYGDMPFALTLNSVEHYSELVSALKLSEDEFCEFINSKSNYGGLSSKEEAQAIAKILNKLQIPYPDESTGYSMHHMTFYVNQGYIHMEFGTDDTTVFVVRCWFTKPDWFGTQAEDESIGELTIAGESTKMHAVENSQWTHSVEKQTSNAYTKLFVCGSQAQQTITKINGNISLTTFGELIK